MAALSSEFLCHNPYCGSRRKSFANEKAYAMHVERAPECLQFLRQQQQQATKDTLNPMNAKRAATLFDVHSTKKPSRLRRDFVNEEMETQYNPTVASVCVVAGTDASKVNNDWDDEDYGVPDTAVQEHGTAANTNALNWNAVVQTPAQMPNMAAMPFMYSTDQKWTIALLKMLDDINAPDYAFPAVLEWARNAHEQGYSFHPTGGVERSRNIDELFKAMHNARRMLPSVTRVVVSHGPPVDVITFEFAPQLLKLLQNKKLMTADNLLINLQDPLRPYESLDGRLGEAISGSVYRDAYNRFITNRDRRQLFVPIIQWIDRTSVTGNARFSLKPYMFTPAIFTEPFRRTIQAWGYHGFLPKAKTSSAQNKVNKPGDNIRNYHDQLAAVLQSFTQAGPQLCDVELPIGPLGSMRVDIVTCILFVIQDMQEGDSLCGRFGTHGLGIQRHCRACNVTEAKLDNPVKSCSFLLAADMALIAGSDNLALRTKWSQHRIPRNVFDHVPMADPIRGIFGATPVETLHAFRKGMIEMVTLLVIDNVPVSKRAALDSLAIRFHRTHRQTYRKAYPATDFSNGITNLTRISASERLGLVFLLVILAQYDEGWALLDNALGARPTAISLRDVLNTFEALLCFDAWLNQPTYWKMEDHAASKISVAKSIRILLRMCKERIPLKDGKTWKFPKFHELLHILEDMERFGATMNYCAQRPESLLIPVAKQPGRRAQKRHDGSEYELQAAQRLSYSLLIDSMYTQIWEPLPADNVAMLMAGDTSDNTNEIFQSSGQATFCTLSRLTGGPLQVFWDAKTHKDLMRQPAALLHFLFDTFGPDNVQYCTEYVRDIYTFRCHPCYQSAGPIYDWMLIAYTDNNNQAQTYPARLAAVVVRPTTTPQCLEPYILVVQSATTKTNKSSVLLTEWNWSPKYQTISPESIAAPCFVISIREDSSKILETRQLHEWPLQFTSPIDEPSSNT